MQLCNGDSLQHAAESQNSKELTTGLQERRRACLRDVPESHHELPGNSIPVFITFKWRQQHLTYNMTFGFTCHVKFKRT